MADEPVFLTVPEVMARLRLSRTTVYDQARRFLATGGAEGLPCQRFGRSLRFPAAALNGPVATTPQTRSAETVANVERRVRRSTSSGDQLALVVEA